MELEPGVEGLVHVSEMSWTKKNVHPGKIVSTSQEVEVMVLEVDPDKRRISLGLKQCLGNPWELFQEQHPVGSTVEGEIRNITEFGLFVGLDNDIDGMVHLSDVSWNKPAEEAGAEHKKGEVVKAVVLDVDVDKERISLGIKQLTKDPFQQATSGLKRGARVTCVVKEVAPTGIEVATTDGVTGFIRKAELSRPRRAAPRSLRRRREARRQGDQHRQCQPTRHAVDQGSGDRGREAAMADYGSSDSGASLGDILGPAIKERQEQQEQSQD